MSIAEATTGHNNPPNPFERFNIRYLSPTMLAHWDAAPATLVLRRIFGVKGKANANMWRGDGVEAGLLFWLHNRDKPEAEINAQKHAVDIFWTRAEGEITDETEAAAALIPGMVSQGVLALADISPRLMGFQFNVEHFLDDMPVALTGKMDFLFEDKTIWELKSTTQCPSSLETVSLSHRWQAATYAIARNQPVNLLYVTAKKYNVFVVEPNDESLKLLNQVAQSLKTALTEAKDGDHLLRSLPLNVSSFYWDDDVRDAYDRALTGQLKALTGPGTETLAAQGYVTFGKHAGKHIKELPSGYKDWLLNPKLSDGGFYDVSAELQDAIRTELVTA